MNQKDPYISRTTTSSDETMTMGNPVLFERAKIAASETPFVEDTKSWPSSVAERISGRDMFSSAKNFTCERGYADNSVRLGARGRKLQSGPDMLARNGRPCVDDGFCRFAMRESIKHLPYHHPCSFKGQRATGDFRIGYDIIVCIHLSHTPASITQNLIAQPNTVRLRWVARGLFLALLLAGAPLAHASTTSGTVSSVYKYAWGTVAGYVNFAPTNGGLTITDAAITGYAWGANTGWINFSATSGGVTNSTAGVLGGYAWDSGGGWVSFTGVTIDSSGKFHGSATGGTVSGTSYILNFDCINCDVRTDWRPASARTSAGGHSSISPVIATVSTTTAGIPSASPPASSPQTASGASGGKTQNIPNPTRISNPASTTTFKNKVASSTARTATTTKIKKSAASSFFNFIRSIVRNIYSGIRAFFRFFLRF